MYEGRFEYRIAQGKAKALVQEQHVRLRFVVLGRHESGRLELACFAQTSAVKPKPGKPSPSLVFLSLEPETGILSKPSAQLGALPWLPDRLLLLRAGASAAPRADQQARPKSRREALDLPRFGLQAADVTIEMQRNVRDIEGAAARRRIELRPAAKTPIELRSKQAVFRVHEHRRTLLVDTDRGIPLAIDASTEIEVFGHLQRRSWSLHLVETPPEKRRLVDSATLRRIANFGAALSKIPTRPDEASASLTAALDSKGPRSVLGAFGPQLLALAQKRARASLARRRLMAARRAKLDAMIGKPAPDFELELLSGGTCSLRDARGKLVFLTFWGVG